MAKIMRVGALDPSMSNFGIARLLLDLDTLTFEVERLRLVETEHQGKKKVVRQNSDDLRRASEITSAFHEEMDDCVICFVEIPHGSQSARAMASYGISIGILSHSPVPLIQVQATEVKMAALGTKTGSKEEMIEWAEEKYPTAPWRRYDRDITKKGVVIRKKGAICDDQEHLADALAAAEAGMKTDQFRQLLAMWRLTGAAHISVAA